MFKAFSVIVFLSVSAAAQQLSSLSGTVLDPAGAAVPGATLLLEKRGQGVQRTAKSDGMGRYAFLQIQPGSYKLTAKAPGLADTVVEEVDVRVSTPATINVVFEKAASVTESVSVSAEAVQVNTTDASLGNAIGAKAILELPLFARNIAGLLGLQPGVTSFNGDATDSRNGAVNGGKSDQANVTLDGIDVNDQQYRYAFTSVLRTTLDSTAEFRTTTANAGADQGRSSGAQIALVTRSGTNEFHGALYEYHRNTATAANRFFNNSTGVARPALLINVFGVRFDGPIIRNKAFFMVNYEGRRDASAVTSVRTVPGELLRQGIVQYLRRDGSVAQLSPQDIRDRADPAKIGVNQAVLNLLRQYPSPNDSSRGDGLNTLGFRFIQGRRTKEDTYITRLDYTVGQNHTLFLRGNLQNDHSGGTAQFPGQVPASLGLENTKGFAVGWTAVINSTFISNTRYGITRQSFDNTGVQTQSMVSFRNLDTLLPSTRGFTLTAPVHNVTQDFALTRGAHDVRFGGVMRWNTIRRRSFARSFHDVSGNSSWLRGSGSEFSRAVGDVDPRFQEDFSDAMMVALGVLSEADAHYNYTIDGSLLAVGAPVLRRFRNEEYEMFVQDSWKVSRGLTVTAGLRYSLMPPVYEANGAQVSPNISLGDWFNLRGALAQQGKSQQDAGRISYLLSNGKGGGPLYDFHKKNFAPRIALAYSPQSKGWLSKLTGGPGHTSIRAGWGMYYDLFGFSLIRQFDLAGFGLATDRTNTAGALTSVTAPRFTGLFDLPQRILLPAPKGGFPSEPDDDFAITNSIDNRVKPPYSQNLSFSVGREFKGGFFVQGSYVGRLSRRSLVQRDLAMPTDYRDPASGVTYFQAAQQMTRLVRANTPRAQMPRIPFWENVWGTAARGNLTATQVIYDVFSQNGNDTTSTLATLDVDCGRLCSKLGPNLMFNPQFSSLAGFSSIGGGNYHAMQWSVRKRFGSGLEMDFNYTLGKSIDLASAAERDGAFSGFLVNPWSPRQLKGVSDYDVTQMWSAYGVWEIPFGKGKRFGNKLHGFWEAVLGGWQLSPWWTQTTELPIGVENGRIYPTNWQDPGFATQVGVVPASKNARNAPAVAGAGGPNIFANPKAALEAYDFTLPGESGQRNGLRADGAFVINTKLAKRFVLPWMEGRHRIQVSWDTFNVTNSVRFDAASASLSLTGTGTFGKYSETLDNPRQMQFALRYEF